MSTVNYTSVIVPPRNDQVHVYTWAAMVNGDVGQALELPWFSDRTVQVYGTFGTGGKVTVQGSLDGNNWATLSDPLGNDLDISSAAQSIASILELTRYIRPAVLNGDGSTSLTAMILVRLTA